jgi:hypothetical protein
VGKAVLLVVVILLVLLLVTRCGGDECDGVRQTFGSASLEYQQCLAQRGGGRVGGAVGGAYGGWSSGSGGHK